MIFSVATSARCSRLSVFAGAFTIEAAEGFDPDDEFRLEIIDGLTSLSRRA
jgi:hypothetical protein